MASDFPVIEYGISKILRNHPFPDMSHEKASEVIRNYWDDRWGIKR